MRRSRGRIGIATFLASVALLGGCSGDESGEAPVAAAGSSFTDGVYYAELRVFGDRGCAIEEITVTGPGIAGSARLACIQGEAWMPQGPIPLGPTHPTAPDVYEYTFRIVQPSGTATATAAIPCYLEAMPSLIEPSSGASVSNPVTLRWATLAGAGWEYGVYTAGGRITVVDQGSTTVTLPPGPQSWFVDVIGVGGHEPGSTRNCAARATGGSFTVAAQ